MFMAYVGIVGFTDKPWTPCRQGTVRAECSVRLRDRRQYTAVASAVGLQKRLCRPISSSPSRCAHYGVRRGKNEKPQRLSSLRLVALLLMRPLPPYGANNRRPFFASLHKSRDGSLCGTVFRHIPLRPFVMQKVYPQGFVCGVESPQGAYYIQVQKSVLRQEHACTSIPVCYHTNFQHNERREIQNAIVMGFPLGCV